MTKRGHKTVDTILITGGAGFIGANLIPYLIDKYQKAQIISIDNYFTGKKENHIANERVTYIRGNTQEIVSIWNSYQHPDPQVVFHLGEYSRIAQSFSDFDQLWEFNLNGTKEVVKFCYEKKAKLVYAGSSSKFGNDGLDENLSPYAWIKAKNVEFIKNYSVWYGMDYVITYFYNVYGPKHIKNGKYATVIGKFEAQFEENKHLTVVSPGTQTRDFTHVRDIVRGMVLCYEKGSGDGYELGTGNPISIIDVAKMFNHKYKIVPERIGEREKGKANIQKVKSLGWEPEMNLKDYILEFTSNYRK